MSISKDNKYIPLNGKYCFAIDRGGTFTDVMCLCPDGRVRTLKLLSEDPARYSDAPREGIRRILKEVNFNMVIYICIRMYVNIYIPIYTYSRISLYAY